MFTLFVSILLLPFHFLIVELGAYSTTRQIAQEQPSLSSSVQKSAAYPLYTNPYILPITYPTKTCIKQKNNFFTKSNCAHMVLRDYQYVASFLVDYFTGKCLLSQIFLVHN